MRQRMEMTGVERRSNSDGEDVALSLRSTRNTISSQQKFDFNSLDLLLFTGPPF